MELVENGGVAEIRFAMSPKTRDEQEEKKVKDQKDLFDQPDGYFDLPSIGLSQLTIKCI